MKFINQITNNKKQFLRTLLLCEENSKSGRILVVSRLVPIKVYPDSVGRGEGLNKTKVNIVDRSPVKWYLLTYVWAAFPAG